jgi:hypothetical protein
MLLTTLFAQPQLMELFAPKKEFIDEMWRKWRPRLGVVASGIVTAGVS